MCFYVECCIYHFFCISYSFIDGKMLLIYDGHLLDGGVSDRTLCFRHLLIASLALVQLQKTRRVIISVKDFVRSIDRGSAGVGFQVSC